MLEWIKSAWAKWKVQVSVAGGVLVVATAYGTCSVDPAAVSDASSTTNETVEIGDAVQVSATTAETETAPDNVDATSSETKTETEQQYMPLADR